MRPPRIPARSTPTYVSEKLKGAVAIITLANAHNGQNNVQPGAMLVTSDRSFTVERRRRRLHQARKARSALFLHGVCMLRQCIW